MRSWSQEGRCAGLLAFVMVCAGCATARRDQADNWPRYVLSAEQVVRLNLPHGEQFDASGLLLTPAGDLLTLNDRSTGLYRVHFRPDTKEADLVKLPDCFTEAQLAPFAGEKSGRHDCEGIAQDERGRTYLCEEANRWILRFDPQTQTVERLPINWSPVKKYFSATDSNASFEGISVGGGKLYVANERDLGRIIVVDLKSFKVVDDFVARPSTATEGDVHYTDLCWFEGALFVLLRESRMVLKVDPQNHRVLAEYDFGAMETHLSVRYLSLIGSMEGLAVDRNFFWLVTDNNGFGRLLNPVDSRPTLFKCPRPDAREGAGTREQ